MNRKHEIIREILGWKPHNKNSWYNVEKEEYVHDSYFMPDQYMEHAMVIVEKLKMFGINYQTNGTSEAKFDDVTGRGETLPEAITNAAYYLILKFYSQFDNNQYNQI
ncbi:hypothetical protein R4Z10_20765 [Niallia sp. XMNu-256]|uniref:BC1872 family protein n=1 Tax=Niallia sp. XMNu-256 TaxID=3082444 RepID=UPI0030CFCE22